MKRLSQVILAGILLLSFSNVSYACEGAYNLGPRLLTVNYLEEIMFAYGISGVSTDGVAYLSSPSDAFARIVSPAVFMDIVNEIEEQFRDKAISFERIIAEVNYKLVQKKNEIKAQTGVDINIDDVRAKLEASIPAAVLTAADTLIASIGLSAGDSITIKKVGVYPVLSDNQYSYASGSSNSRDAEAFQEKEITTTVKGFITDWIIGQQISGLSGSTEDAFRRINYFYNRTQTEFQVDSTQMTFKDAVGHYLGESLDLSKGAHLSALLNLGLEFTLGAFWGANDLIAIGAEEIVEQAEAYFGQEFWSTGSSLNQATGKYERVLITDPYKKIGKDMTKFLGNKIAVTRRILDSLNAANNYTGFYGRQLSMNNVFDQGLISSYVGRYYSMLRENNYNPVANVWSNYISKDQAIGLVNSYITIGSKLKPLMDEVFGRIDLEAKDLDSELKRRVLADWSEIAYKFAEYGEMSEDAAIDIVKQLLPKVDVALGTGGMKEVILGKTQGDLGILRALADAFGTVISADFDKNSSTWSDKINSQYKGALAILYDGILKFKEVFNVTSSDLGALVAAAKEMISIGKEAGLPSLVEEDYLGLRNFPVDDSRFMGKYTFWNQVLYAQYKQSGNLNQAKEYVELQLKARQLIRQKMGNNFDATVPGNLSAFEAFENKLAGDLSNLGDILAAVSQIRDKVVFDDVKDIIATLPDPSTSQALWPATRERAVNFTFPVISQDAITILQNEGLLSSAANDELDLGIAIVPDLGSPDFGTTSAPIF